MFHGKPCAPQHDLHVYCSGKIYSSILRRRCAYSTVVWTHRDVVQLVCIEQGATAYSLVYTVLRPELKVCIACTNYLYTHDPSHYLSYRTCPALYTMLWHHGRETCVSALSTNLLLYLLPSLLSTRVLRGDGRASDEQPLASWPQLVPPPSP